MTEHTAIPAVTIRHIEADGVNVFYREAGPKDAPVVVLLHGFPTSSFQYRELIPRLADRYRVIAPDLPGFGFTEVPEERKYTYSFDALAHNAHRLTNLVQLHGVAVKGVADRSDDDIKVNFVIGKVRSCTAKVP